MKPALSSGGVGRTAPSTTGYPHPGTLLSALLAWLDARAAGARFVLRLEDLDTRRTRPAYVQALTACMGWLGLDVDAAGRQSERAKEHAQALDGLAERGLLYACSCSRARLRTLEGASGDVGTAAYDNHCRGHSGPLSRAGWRACPEVVRLQLAAETSGANVANKHGDPIVRRRDGSVGYALAAVVDDAAAQVSRVVRGQDLAVHEALHRRIYACLHLAAPSWRHHPLLWAQAGADKLSKQHHSFPIDPAAPPMAASALLGRLAFLLQLAPAPEPTTAQALLAQFDWAKLPAPTTRLVWQA